MNIKEISYFIELAKEKNFTKASKNLYISQPALSKSIKNLENEVKTQLIERNTKGFKLTYEGEVFYENAKKSIDIINRELSILQDTLNNCKKTITIGIPPVIGSVYFTSVIAQFRDEYPDIDINIVEEGSNNIKHRIEDESIELGAVILPIESGNIISTPIINDEVMLVVSKKHHLSNKKSINLKELKDEKFIMFNEEFMMHDKTVKACNEMGFNPNVMMKTSQWDFIIEMVALNQGITIMPKPIVTRFKTKETKMISITKPYIDWNIGFITKKNKYMSKSSKLFCEYAINKIRENLELRHYEINDN